MPSRAASCRNWDPGCGSVGAVQRGRSWVNIAKTLNRARTMRQLPFMAQMAILCVFACRSDWGHAHPMSCRVSWKVFADISPRLGRQACLAKFPHIFPRLSPSFPIFGPRVETPEKAGVI